MAERDLLYPMRGLRNRFLHCTCTSFSFKILDQLLFKQNFHKWINNHVFLFVQIQLVRIQMRVPEYGWTTQKVFHLMNFLVNGGKHLRFISESPLLNYKGLTPETKHLPRTHIFSEVSETCARALIYTKLNSFIFLYYICSEGCYFWFVRKCFRN